MMGRGGGGGVFDFSTPLHGMEAGAWACISKCAISTNRDEVEQFRDSICL